MKKSLMLQKLEMIGISLVLQQSQSPYMPMEITPTQLQIGMKHGGESHQSRLYVVNTRCQGIAHVV